MLAPIVLVKVEVSGSQSLGSDPAAGVTVMYGLPAGCVAHVLPETF